MTLRRVVTADVDGSSAVVTDEPVEAVSAGATTSFESIWRSDVPPAVPNAGEVTLSYELPAPGAVWVLRYTLAPGESAEVPGFHRTDSVDVNVVVDGVVTVELDGGVELDIHAGESIVLNGNLHAWHNRTSADASMLVTMIGATRGDIYEG